MHRSFGMALAVCEQQCMAASKIHSCHQTSCDNVHQLAQGLVFAQGSGCAQNLVFAQCVGFAQGSPTTHASKAQSRQQHKPLLPVVRMLGLGLKPVNSASITMHSSKLVKTLQQ